MQKKRLVTALGLIIFSIMQPLSTLLVTLLYQFINDDVAQKNKISLWLSFIAAAVLMMQSITGLGLGWHIMSRKSLEKPKVKKYAHRKFYFEILALIEHFWFGGAMRGYPYFTVGIVLLLVTLLAALISWYISFRQLFKDHTWVHLLCSFLACSLLIAT